MTSEDQNECCHESASCCLCSEPTGHEGPHSCECGGKWTGEFGDGDFDVVEYPPLPSYLASVLASMEEGS
jgi:hypothetical protein